VKGKEGEMRTFTLKKFRREEVAGIVQARADLHSHITGKDMVRFGNLFLAQSAVNTMADLKSAVGHGLGIIVIISYMYAVILIIIMACVQERGDGSWKYALARGIALFAATGVANILLAMFFPGQTITVNFG
jgi:hypothetical protein